MLNNHVTVYPKKNRLETRGPLDNYGVLNVTTSFSDLFKKRKPLKAFCQTSRCLYGEDLKTMPSNIYRVTGLHGFARSIKVPQTKNICPHCDHGLFWSRNYTELELVDTVYVRQRTTHFEKKE